MNNVKINLLQIYGVDYSVITNNICCVNVITAYKDDIMQSEFTVAACEKDILTEVQKLSDKIIKHYYSLKQN